MSGRTIRTLAKELAGYETTSGAIHFPFDEPLPAKLVNTRLVEIEAQATRRSRRASRAK